MVVGNCLREQARQVRERARYIETGVERWRAEPAPGWVLQFFPKPDNRPGGSTLHRPDVRVGDRVVATDPETGRTRSEPVEATVLGEGTKTLVDVAVAPPGSGTTGSVVATDAHPFWVGGSVHAWTDAAENKTKPEDRIPWKLQNGRRWAGRSEADCSAAKASTPPRERSSPGMTDHTELHGAWERFRSLPYPEYPRTEALRDWNSELLTLDGNIPGYASQVADGRLAASEVPEPDTLARAVERLAADLEALRPAVPDEAGLLDRYRDYLAALLPLVRALAALAGAEDAGSAES
ncbi:hypothetical protein ACIF70_36295 [Actinacidiphila glaucinigra]|uniref:hypothetical protein n=1 Tax=Actinacidiphila glaucinigra TaxID=235986 RepID=UPI0037C5F6D8